jgi:hypothetical protein
MAALLVPLVPGTALAYQVFDAPSGSGGAHDPARFPVGREFDIGADTGTPVEDRDYQVPFWFTGTLTKLTLSWDRWNRGTRTER